MLSAEIERLRNDLHRHQDEDRQAFQQLHEAIQVIRKCLDEWTGAVNLGKWALGLGLPALVGLGVAHVARHW